MNILQRDFFGEIMYTYRIKTGGQVLLIPVDDIEPPENYERSFVASDELELLAESIREIGMINPVIVRSIEGGRYRIVAGERRRLAAGLAGLAFLPALLINENDEMYSIYSVAENMHRSEVHFLDTARYIEKLRDSNSIESVAQRLSIPEGQILSKIHLLSLPDNIKWKMINGRINEKDALKISRIVDPKIRNDVTELMMNSSLSFNEAYEEIKAVKKKTVFCAKYRDVSIFVNTIQHALDTMKESGIKAESSRTEDDNKIVYTVTINKLI